MSTKPRHSIIFVKTFSNGGLNNIEEALITFFDKSSNWKVKVLVINYGLFGVDLPKTKLTYKIITLNKKWFFYSKIFGRGITLLIYLLFGIYGKLENPFYSTLIRENPDVVIWSHDSLSYIPFIPYLRDTKQFFLFQEWLREKNEHLYKIQPLFKQKIWSIIRSIILGKSTRFLKNIDAVFYHSPLVLQMIKKTLKQPIKVHLHEVPIGINIKQYNTLKKIKRDKDIKTILYIGPLSDFKGVYLISKALIQIRQQYGIKLRLINVYYKKGRNYTKIKRQLESNNIPLIFKESISDDEKISIINESDLLLHVPRIEPYGLTILEALSCGLKVVIYKKVGVKHYLRNQKGLYVFHNYSSDQLIKTILNALKQQLQPEEIRRSFLQHNLTDRIFFKNFEEYVRKYL